MTVSQATASNSTPTGELPIVPSPTPRAAVQAAAADRPDNLIERIKHGQALKAAETLEQYCSTYRAGRHRAGDRPGREVPVSLFVKPSVERQASHAVEES